LGIKNNMEPLELKGSEIAEDELRNALHASRQDKYYIRNERIVRVMIDKLGIDDAADIAKKILMEIGQ